MWRAFYETMRDIAAATGAHVVASTNVSGSIERSEAPADVAALADPDLPGAEHVYVAKDRAIYNTAFVFSPSGEIIGRARKPYLVDSEEKDLLLTYGALRDVAPIDIGFARLGVVTSTDAWMPDMVGRLAALGADVFVQPEAFSGWTIEEVPGASDWLPDVVKQSGWAAAQKHAGYRYAVIPHLTGNLFDQVFDGQSAILGDAAPGEASPSYSGHDPEGGFIALAPWVAGDPGAEDPALSLDERRKALRSVGQELAPGGARENEYIETVVAADIDPKDPFPMVPGGDPGALGPSAPIDEAAEGEQAAPSIAGDSTGLVVLVWQDSRDGRPQIYAARSTDVGATFGGASSIAPSPGAQTEPSVTATGTSVRSEPDPRRRARRYKRLAPRARVHRRGRGRGGVARFSRALRRYLPHRERRPRRQFRAGAPDRRWRRRTQPPVRAGRLGLARRSDHRRVGGHEERAAPNSICLRRPLSSARADRLSDRTSPPSRGARRGAPAFGDTRPRRAARPSAPGCPRP